MRSRVKLCLVVGVCGVLVTAAYAKSTSTRKASSALPDLNPGEGWEEQTALPPKGGEARAWSDLAAGCHLALFTLPASERVGEAPLRASLEATLAAEKMAISDDDSGFLRITGVALDGLASLSIGDTPVRSASLLACYWNEREPARCQALCLRALQNQNKATQ